MESLKMLIVIFFIVDRLTYFFHAISIPNGPFRGIVGNAQWDGGWKRGTCIMNFELSFNWMFCFIRFNFPLSLLLNVFIAFQNLFNPKPGVYYQYA